ncbi:Acyl- N-acyltransferase [Lecanosticta acicola]|uniref:Acyl- N-acyltransferase n=1 Tax=Lecanosticta acicola TaxID=111012 RepID=A0AAI8YTB4_9PEZI|nr:Acyl- N-acyltransferase [Lecanosticta acicola]
MNDLDHSTPLAEDSLSQKYPTAGIKITTCSQAKRQVTEYKFRTAEVLSRAFRTDPVIRFLTSSLSDEAHNAYLESYMHTLVKAAILNDAKLEEAEGWQCVAVWMPPRKRVDNIATIVPAGFIPVVARLGLGGAKAFMGKRMLWDFQAQSDKMKKKHLQGIKDYWYLFFIATEEEARGQGLATRIIARYQNFAAKDGLPIWLEATTAHSRDIYLRCGFKQLDQLVMGKGTHASTGKQERGGSGVKLWPMIWKPESISKAINGN